MSNQGLVIGLLIKHIQHRNFRLLEGKLAPLGISIVQWNALRTIHRHPDSCMRHLAKMTFNSDQAIGTLVARLKRLKMIERLPGGVGRATRHRLTPKGATLLQQGTGLVHGTLTGGLTALSPEERQVLQQLLAKLLDDGRPEDL